jgi:hypothetical protein
VGSYRIVLGLVALAAALLAPLAVGQFWMTLITQIYMSSNHQWGQRCKALEFVDVDKERATLR